MTSSLQLDVKTLSLMGQTLDVRPSDCVGNVGGVEADSTPADCRAASVTSISSVTPEPSQPVTLLIFIYFISDLFVRE